MTSTSNNTPTDMSLDGTRLNTKVLSSVMSYSAIKAHASGGQVINLYNKLARESLAIKTPFLMTWGAQEAMDQQNNKLGKWSMSLQFPSDEYPNESGKAFLASMIALESKIKDDAMEHSKDWFGKTCTSRETMDEKFNPMLKYPRVKGNPREVDYSKAPTLTVKLPCWSKVWKTNVYDENKKPLFTSGVSSGDPLEFLPSRSQVKCLIQCGGLWIVNGKVSITWNVMQVLVQRPTIRTDMCLLDGPSVSEMAQLKSSGDTSAFDDEDEVEPPHEEAAAPTETMVADSDDDVESETETEPVEERVAEPVAVAAEPLAEPVVKKPRRIVKK